MTTIALESTQLSNPNDYIFKSDITKLTKLAENMITSGQIATPWEFAKNFMFSFDSEEKFPINIEQLVELKIYDRKDNAKKILTKTFIKDTDYIVKKPAPEFSGAGFKNIKNGKNIGSSGMNKENIMLTVDCFKNMCMLSRNEMGKKIQRYYLDLEKVFKKYILIELANKDLQIVYEKRQNKQITIKLKKQTKDFRRLRKNHNSLLRIRNYHKFKLGMCLYIWSDPDSSVIKCKVGYTSDINGRLKTYRTSVPNLHLLFLVYLENAKFLESGILSKYKDNRVPLNHEIVHIKPEEIIKSCHEIIDYFNFSFEVENELEQYNKINIIDEEDDKEEINEEEKENNIDEEEEKIEEEIDIDGIYKDALEKISKCTNIQLDIILGELKLKKKGVKKIKLNRIRVALDNKELQTINVVINTYNIIQKEKGDKKVVPKGKKTCSKCREVKLYSEFSKSPNRADGHDNQCKLCKKKNYIKRKAKKKKEVGLKKCATCDVVKKPEEFYKRIGSPDGLSSQCKNCVINQYHKRSENREYDEVKSKECVECKEEKKIEHFGKKRDSLDGYMTRCKPCWNAYSHRNGNSVIPKKKKVCTTCKIMKGIDKFWNKKQNRDGKDHKCKSCWKVYK